MKGKIIGKILIILLAIVMVLPLSAFAVSAEEIPNTNAVPEYIEDIYRNGRTPSEQAEYEEFIRLMKMKEDSSRIDEMFKEKPKGLDKETSKQITDGIENFRKSLPGLVQSINDAKDGGDFDTASCIDNVISLANTALVFVPYGDIVSSVLDLGNTIFKLAMGGESSTSEMVQMEDRLNQQLDDIQNQLSEIEEQINGLSDEINESTNTIINEVTSAIDNVDAKAELRRFMLSGEGNFSYNQYRNYIYGTIENNPKANTAYYSWLKKSLSDGASDETVKYYYDKLYSSIIADMDAYYDYVVGSDNSKSIVQYYYDVVSARPNGTANGLSAKDAAIMFAYDLYQTELMASQIIMSCNLYQYTYMYENGDLVNVIDESGNVTGKKIAPLEIYYYDNDNAVNFVEVDGGMWEQLNDRINDIHDQLASDIAYILNLDDSYIVESADGDLFEVVNSDPDTYGKVLAGQTIYLNTIPEEICDLFGFDANDFTYVVSVLTDTDGAFYVDSNASIIEATLYYNGEELEKMSFTVGTNAKFNGGNGTASDPYLIASAAQFARISDGLDKHYRLICDIDFNGATITPIGQKVNSNDAIVYDEFVGSLDGNGYTISNLKVIGHTNTGLFGVIGETGEVADLKLYNVKVSANITNAEKSTSEFYAGMIVGKNNGIIKYCSVDSNGTTAKITVPNYDLTPDQLFTGPWTKEVDAPIYGLFLDVNNSTRNRNIYAYAGGIAGANNYAVVGCTVANSHISASSTHNFGGDKTSTNKNNVYVGGVCGYSYGVIAHSIVKESVKISSYAKSIYNPETTVNPYVVAHAGGIVAKVNSLSDICQVESSAVIIRNDADLDCESNGGKHYKNCSAEKDAYIPKYSEDELKAIVATEDVEAFIAKTERNYTVTFNCPDTVYEAGSDAFKTDNLKFFINGVEMEYEIVGIYGFDAQNEEFNSVPQNIVILFSVEIEGETVYFAQDITVTIEENVVTSIEILNLKDSYVKDTFSLEGLVIKYNYAVGNPEYVTINSENISQVRYFGNITTFGTQSIALLYNGDTVEFEINVVCGHGNNFTSPASGYTYDESLSKEPTCTEIGYNSYVCDTCGDVQCFYLRKTEHTPDYENAVGATDATCTEEGNTGKICCVDCGETLIDGKVIPKLNHHYVYVDGDKHACSNGSHSEYHHYTVTESVQLLDPDKNGTKEWYIVYTYTCICQKENSEQYSKIEIDENSDTNETKELPTIAVSNGYVTNGGKEVVVYVQLINNPGLKSAVFGIRYDRGLELVGDPQIGNLFKNLTINEKEQIDYGYNFVFANAALVSGDSNLVKLTFKVTDDAKIGDIFNISVVYNEMGKSVDGTPIMGGFSNGEQINVVTRDGYVKVVGEGQLPGDVNNDNIVDLMDAVLLAKFYANSEKHPLSAEDADINLDRDITPDDIVALLEYLIGGYGTNLLTQDFEIVLNTNGYGDIVLNDLLVSIYGDNNTYDAAGLNAIIAEIENRTGYKFLGWYDQMVGGNLIFGGDKTEDVLVVYNKNQKKQTLYAHWELNKLVFDITDATSVQISDIIYTDDPKEIEIPDEPTREYDVIFHSSEFNKNKSETLIYSFDYFRGSNGEIYYTVEEAVNALLRGYDGELKLTAVWDESSPKITFPVWTQEGYENFGWYGDSECNSREINKAQDILSKATKDGDIYRIYAKHVPIEFSVSFDFNGGSGSGYSSITDKSYTIKSTINLPQVSATKTYNELIGWDVYIGDTFYCSWTKGSTINGIVVNNANTIVVFKAQWKGEQYKVIYDGNRPTNATYNVSNIPTTATWTYDSNATLAAAPTLTGWKFDGWYRNSQCTVKAGSANTTLTAPNYYEGSDVVLYAKWVQKDATVTFNANGGNVSQSSKTVKFDGIYGDLPTPTMDDYAFVGWFTESTGGTQITSETPITFTESKIVYAQWIPTVEIWEATKENGRRGNNPADLPLGMGTMLCELGYSIVLDSDNYIDSVAPVNLDLIRLKELGYRSVRIKITLTMKELLDGYQEFWVYNDIGTLWYVEFEHGPGYENNSEATYTFYSDDLDINNFSSNGSFNVKYGANGEDGDTWLLGATTITIEVIK